MRIRRMRLVGALGVLLGAAMTPPTLAAQSARPAWLAPQPALEGFYTRLHLDAASPLSAEGVGGRLLWGMGRAGATEPSRLADRAALGLFVAHMPDRQRGFSTLHLGAALDVQPLDVESRIAPLVSLGAGALRTSVRPGAHELRDASPLTAGSNTALTLLPGVGARVDVASGLALRGDVRDLVTFRGGTRHNVALEAGIRLTR